MVFALHRVAKVFKVRTDISRNRNHQAYSAEGYQLSVAYIKVKILGETSVKESETQCSLLPAALSFSLIGLSHEPGALGIIINPLGEVYASLNLTYILYHIFFEKSNFHHFVVHWRKSFHIFMSKNTQKKIISINFFDIDTSGIGSDCRTTFRTS